MMKNSKIQVSITGNQLSEEVKEEMWQVYHKYYHYSREYFMQRIERNNYFSFYRSEGRIIGFTGLRINRTSVGQKECLLIYFGQTIIDKAFRGKALIPRTATKLCLRYWKDILLGRVYVWADALTYKAYLVFAKTIAEYYPTYKRSMPKHIKQLIQFVGVEYYGNTFNEATGTITKDQLLVNDPCTKIKLSETRDKDVRFYLEANENYTLGHGLITMAPMHLSNYLCVVARSLKKIIGSKAKSPKPNYQLQKVRS
jgi:hypothetical protein